MWPRFRTPFQQLRIQQMEKHINARNGTDVSLFQQQLTHAAHFWAVNVFSLNSIAGWQLCPPHFAGDSREPRSRSVRARVSLQSQAPWLLRPALVCLPELLVTLLGKQAEVTFSWNFLTCLVTHTLWSRKGGTTGVTPGDSCSPGRMTQKTRAGS